MNYIISARLLGPTEYSVQSMSSVHYVVHSLVSTGAANVPAPSVIKFGDSQFRCPTFCATTTLPYTC